MRFRNRHGTKSWTVFDIRKSPTTTLHKHFQNEHPDLWEAECTSLGVPQKDVKGQAPVLEEESFTRDGFMSRLMKFIVANDQVSLQRFSFLPASE